MIDIYSETWRDVERFCNDEEQTLTNALIAGSDPRNEDQIRGQIRFIHRLRELARPRQTPPDQPVSYT